MSILTGNNPFSAFKKLKQELNVMEAADVKLKNMDYGFAGTLKLGKKDYKKELPAAVKALMNLGTFKSPEQVGHFLDSRSGRHYADQIIGGKRINGKGKTHVDIAKEFHKSAKKFVKGYDASYFEESYSLVSEGFPPKKKKEPTDQEAPAPQETPNADSGQQPPAPQQGQAPEQGQEDPNAVQGQPPVAGQEDPNAVPGQEDPNAIDGQEDPNAVPGQEDPNAEVDINGDSVDVNGDGVIDQNDDMNNDGAVDQKDVMIMQLQKDLQIRQLQRDLEAYDDPAEGDPTMMGAPPVADGAAPQSLPTRLRVKDRGTHFEAIDDEGNTMKKFPYDNIGTFSRQARYDAQRYAEKYYALQAKGAPLPQPEVDPMHPQVSDGENLEAGPEYSGDDPMGMEQPFSDQGQEFDVENPKGFGDNKEIKGEVDGEEDKGEFGAEKEPEFGAEKGTGGEDESQFGAEKEGEFGAEEGEGGESEEGDSPEGDGESPLGKGEGESQDGEGEEKPEFGSDKKPAFGGSDDEGEEKAIEPGTENQAPEQDPKTARDANAPEGDDQQPEFSDENGDEKDPEVDEETGLEVHSSGALFDPETGKFYDRETHMQIPSEKIMSEAKVTPFTRLDNKVIKTLRSMDKEEARMVINGLPKVLQKQANDALGLKENVDGRTRAFKETAARLLFAKEKKKTAELSQKATDFRNMKAAEDQEGEAEPEVAKEVEVTKEEVAKPKTSIEAYASHIGSSLKHEKAGEKK